THDSVSKSNDQKLRKNIKISGCGLCSAPPACVLCRRADSDPDRYGEKRRKDGLCAHETCLYLASGLPVRHASETGTNKFLPADIRHAVKWRLALGAGFFCFQCPQCKDRETFLREMSSLGIRVPLRQPTWEADGALAELYERHRRCDASRCLCARGQEEAAEEGPWQLLLCSSCAAKGTHCRCSALRPTTATWEIMLLLPDSTDVQNRTASVPHNPLSSW
uniref:PHF7/G2E3-like PHD zinc finger domain-containing protein n=1 Tax=Apteryx owenii TaxID=8824 RepID=A0A8B9QBV2_APTOW